MLKKYLNWLYVILWMSVIFYFSSQPDLKSTLPTFWDFIFRKIAHISEFFVLAYFLFKAVREHQPSWIFALSLTFVISEIYAGFDEFHQTFTAGRSGNIIDVGIDSIGVMLFVSLRIMYNNSYENLRYK